MADDEEAPCNCGAQKCRGSMYSAEELRRRKRLAQKQTQNRAACKNQASQTDAKKKQVQASSRLTKQSKAAKTEGKKIAAKINLRDPRRNENPQQKKNAKKAGKSRARRLRMRSISAATNCGDSARRAAQGLNPAGWRKRYNQRAGQLATHIATFLLDDPMAYQVLARKYRPQRFADVIGQDHVTQTLLNALAQDRIAHGYIFSGHRGIGKTTIARILAMALQCRTPQGTPERPTPEPCGICDACTEIRAGNAMDVIEIDAATNRGIDEIRELREGARYSPARDRYKIYILDEAHQITDAAFNALLKTLEEPPAHVIFMMATTQPEDIPQTIRSRSQHFSFHAVRFQEIVAQLRSIAEKESVAVDEAALSLLAEAGDGSMRDALSIMDQAIASAPLVNGAHTLEASQIRSLMGTVSNQVFENMMEAVKEQNAASMLRTGGAIA